MSRARTGDDVRTPYPSAGRPSAPPRRDRTSVIMNPIAPKTISHTPNVQPRAKKSKRQAGWPRPHPPAQPTPAPVSTAASARSSRRDFIAQSDRFRSREPTSRIWHPLSVSRHSVTLTATRMASGYGWTAVRPQASAAVPASSPREVLKRHFRTLGQASIYGVAAARSSILAGALVRLGRLLIP